MGIYSTVDITKDECLERIADALLNAIDEQLAHVLWVLVGDVEFSNFKIIPYKGYE